MDLPCCDCVLFVIRLLNVERWAREWIETQHSGERFVCVNCTAVALVVRVSHGQRPWRHECTWE